MIAEMELDLAKLDLRLLKDGPDNEMAWLYYRTRREWAVPASEAQRLGAGRDKLIAVRVREALPPEFKRGDLVMLDRSDNHFSKDDYYGVIFEREYVLAKLRAGDEGFLLMNRHRERAQSIPARTIHIIGRVVFSVRRRGNFEF
jgi:hypothetical protein